MRDTFFLDLDGTLLPLDMNDFFTAYYAGAQKSGIFDQICESEGKEIFEKAVHEMLANDGAVTNEELFFCAIERMSGVERDALQPVIEGFYTGEFIKLKKRTRTDKRVVKVIRLLQEKGYRLILATQPLFPTIATDQRIAWAGLKTDDFEYISYYHNSHYCKPKPQYFEEIMDHIGVTADRCYIVGNDVRDDMSALGIGFEGFLVLDHVFGDIEKVGECKKGDYSDLLSFVESLPQI